MFQKSKKNIALQGVSLMYDKCKQSTSLFPRVWLVQCAALPQAHRLMLNCDAGGIVNKTVRRAQVLPRKINRFLSHLMMVGFQLPPQFIFFGRLLYVKGAVHIFFTCIINPVQIRLQASSTSQKIQGTIRSDDPIGKWQRNS